MYIVGSLSAAVLARLFRVCLPLFEEQQCPRHYYLSLTPHAIEFRLHSSSSSGGVEAQEVRDTLSHVGVEATGLVGVCARVGADFRAGEKAGTAPPLFFRSVQ